MRRLQPFGVVSYLYQLVQIIISLIFSPVPPSAHAKQAPLGHVAIVGAGLTGISSASHLIGHGFEVTIFEAGGKENLGGIWSRVNSTSGLQISSIMYRWHPAVLWTKGYPKRDEILENCKKIWKKYDLEKRTRFNVSCLFLLCLETHTLTLTFPPAHGRLPSAPSLGTRARRIHTKRATRAGSSTARKPSTTAWSSRRARAARQRRWSCLARTSSRASSPTRASSTTWSSRVKTSSSSAAVPRASRRSSWPWKRGPRSRRSWHAPTSGSSRGPRSSMHCSPCSRLAARRGSRSSPSCFSASSTTAASRKRWRPPRASTSTRPSSTRLPSSTSARARPTTTAGMCST